jgi:hypothetical protein
VAIGRAIDAATAPMAFLFSRWSKLSRLCIDIRP